jgi:hypothetical protein
MRMPPHVATQVVAPYRLGDHGGRAGGGAGVDWLWAGGVGRPLPAARRDGGLAGRRSASAGGYHHYSPRADVLPACARLGRGRGTPSRGGGGARPAAPVRSGGGGGPPPPRPPPRRARLRARRGAPSFLPARRTARPRGRGGAWHRPEPGRFLWRVPRAVRADRRDQSRPAASPRAARRPQGFARRARWRQLGAQPQPVGTPHQAVLAAGRRWSLPAPGLDLAPRSGQARGGDLGRRGCG